MNRKIREKAKQQFNGQNLVLNPDEIEFAEVCKALHGLLSTEEGFYDLVHAILGNTQKINESTFDEISTVACAISRNWKLKD